MLPFLAAEAEAEEAAKNGKENTSKKEKKKEKKDKEREEEKKRRDSREDVLSLKGNRKSTEVNGKGKKDVIRSSNGEKSGMRWRKKEKREKGKEKKDQENGSRGNESDGADDDISDYSEDVKKVSLKLHEGEFPPSLEVRLCPHAVCLTGILVDRVICVQSRFTLLLRCSNTKRQRNTTRSGPVPWRCCLMGLCTTPTPIPLYYLPPRPTARFEGSILIDAMSGRKNNNN